MRTSDGKELLQEMNGKSVSVRASEAHRRSRSDERGKTQSGCRIALALHTRSEFFVVPTGIEPVTQGFSVLCSTN